MEAYLVWLIIGVGFFLLELAMPVFVLFFFGVGAWTAALAAWGNQSFRLEIFIFILSSTVTLLLFRRLMRNVFSGGTKKPEQEKKHEMVGRRGVASREIRAGQTGEVDVSGSFWRAVSDDDIPRGEEVSVVGALPDDEMTLKVVPLGNLKKQEFT
ncbi:MAG: NfeD family protein [Desulfovibrio sp.]|jgi:membrane protein implicated in regulation of membrane protease activity|nr:NfeD family protein [Desulfovibrio sp.]